MSDNIYKMAIANTVKHIRNSSYGEGPNAFDASYYLSLAFCKSKEDVFNDIIFYKNTGGNLD